MTPCFSEACTMPASFAEDVAAAGEAGFSLLEVWLTKLEQHLQAVSTADTHALLASREIRLAAAAYQGGLLLSQGEARKAHFEHFRQRLAMCEGFGIGVMLLVADFQKELQPADLERAVVSLAQAGQWAAGFGVRLGLEFRAADTFCSSLETAVRLVEACGEANVGVCLDLFHFEKGPSKFADLELLTAENLTWVQVSDLAGVPRELATDADRIFPGDGDRPLKAVIDKLREVGYEGPVSLEMMNPTFWQVPPAQVAGLGYSSMDRLLRHHPTE